MQCNDSMKPLLITVNGGATTALAIDSAGNTTFGGTVGFGSTTTFQANDIIDIATSTFIGKLNIEESQISQTDI